MNTVEQQDSEPDTPHAFLFSFGFAAVLFSILSGPFRFWYSESLPILPASRYSLIIAFVLTLIGWFLAKRKAGQVILDPFGFASGLLLVFFSDWLTRGYNLFQGPGIRGELIIGALIFFVLLRHGAQRFLSIFFILACTGLMLCFFHMSDGRLLFSDDHATFLFRLIALKENFPDIPYYNPFWNGGVDQKAFFATGVLNTYFLFAPLIHFFHPETIYNVIVALTLFVLAPGLTWLAARLEDSHPSVAPIAGLLSLSSSLFWYRWALKYGTMGFITSVSFIPLIMVLTARIICSERKIQGWHLALFVVTFTLMILWTGSGLAIIPCILLGGFYLKTALAKRFVLSTALVVLALNVPWIILFWETTGVNSMLKESHHKPARIERAAGSMSGQSSLHQNGETRTLSPEKSLQLLRSKTGPMNPLIIFLALPGILLLKRRSSRLVFGTTAIWLLVLGTGISFIVPLLELDRMLIVLGFVLSIPSAVAISTLIEQSKRRFQLAITSLAGGFLLIGPFVVAAIVENKSVEKYFFAGETVKELTESIKAHGGNGRVMFAGSILQDLSGGHTAPLAPMTGRPLMASSYRHDIWEYKDIIPARFREKGDAGKDDFMNLYNVTAVIAHERAWKEYFNQRPGAFQFAGSSGKFNLYKRVAYNPSYFIEGSGKITSQKDNQVTLNLTTDEAVIKFNYIPALTSSECTLAPHPIDDEITFIRISNCASQMVAIRGTTGFSRLKG